MGELATMFPAARPTKSSNVVPAVRAAGASVTVERSMTWTVTGKVVIAAYRARSVKPGTAMSLRLSTRPAMSVKGTVL